MAIDSERSVMLQEERGGYKSVPLSHIQPLVSSGRVVQITDGIYRILSAEDMIKQGEEYTAKIPFGD